MQEYWTLVDLMRDDLSKCSGIEMGSHERIYKADDVDAHIAALQAQHAEAIEKLERRIAVIYDGNSVYAEMGGPHSLIDHGLVSTILDAVARIWRRLP